MIKTSLLGALHLTLLLISATGCSPAKARVLQTAATQFKVEATAAIDTIIATVHLEVSPPSRSQAQADREYVESLKSVAASDLKSDTSPDGIDVQQLLETAIDPYAVELDSGATGRINEFALLKTHYESFAASFAELDRASMFAAKPVKAAGPVAKKLTFQMVSYAQMWSKSPPKLLQHRSAVLTELERVLTTAGVPDDVKAQRLLEIKESWLAIIAQEETLQRRVVEQCLKAATVGRQVSQAIDEYDQLSLEDISHYMNFALEQAGAITGKDLAKLKVEAASALKSIEDDPTWKQLADDILDEIKSARRKDAGGSEDAPPSNGGAAVPLVAPETTQPNR